MSILCNAIQDLSKFRFLPFQLFFFFPSCDVNRWTGSVG